jgi:hypothetical protein
MRDNETMADTYPIDQCGTARSLLRKINVALADHRFPEAERLAWVVEMLLANERHWK